ncbi:MAG: pilus assembly protein TadG-related protein [Bdellovibrionota bacterium]
MVRGFSGEKGQASLMLGVMMLTFLLLFAFVVNTGMLVNAKINLQNAADMAAYAGAATQARQLNQISFLNYEMRRQYKKFLFRYYVMGNMAQDTFPRTGGSGKPTWGPKAGVLYNVPVVCLIFNPQDNFCHLDKLPQITIPTANPLDAISQTLAQQLQQIETIRQNNCKKIGATNTLLLQLWLFNSDPQLENIAGGLAGDRQSIIKVIQGIAEGVGLIPREVLLRARIKTLESYVNAAPLTGVDLDKANALKTGVDPSANERTIQAYLSAFHTLGDNSFDSSTIKLDEMLPGGGDQANLLHLIDLKTKFDAYAIDYPASLNGAQATDCVPVIDAVSTQLELPVGVSKDLGTLTYYAVHLNATAQVLFSPFGPMELSAYSAAQPFGSRIGPPAEAVQFVRESAEITNIQPKDGLSLNKKIPNLQINDTNDSTAAGGGWDRQEVLAEMFKGFADPTNGVAPSTIDANSMERAYQRAMIPNPFEGNKYNIANDLGNDDPFIRYFDASHIYAFWAPVFPPGKATGTDELKQTLQALFGSDPAAQGGTGLTDQLTKALDIYIGKMRGSGGEDGEGFNVVRLRDPYFSQPNNGQTAQPLNVGAGIQLTGDKLKSSWVTQNDSDMSSKGRIGYSVKFVSFASLLNHSNKTDGTGSDWKNDVPPAPGHDDDLKFLKH